MAVSIESTSEPATPFPASAAGESTWGPWLFVWGAWAALLGIGLVLVVKFHHHIPLWPGDDWGRIFGWIAGVQPMTLKELWAPEFQHRLLLVTVVLVALMKASAGDYWSVALFYVACMSVLSFAFLRAAKSIRGHASYTDAILPLTVFVGMFTDYLFYGNWLTYFAEAWVAGGAFVIMVRRGTQLTLGWGILAAILLILLPSGIGAGGPLYFPVLFSWLVYSVFVSWRARSLSGRGAAVVLALVAVAVVLMGLYFRGLSFAEKDSPVKAATRSELILTWVAWFTGSLGGACGTFWPYSGLAMALLFPLTAGMLAVTLWRGGKVARSRALGLAFYLAAIAMFGLGFSWGRAGGGGPVVALWYWPLATVVIPWFYFTWELCLPRTVSQFAQMCLLVVVCFVVALDMDVGIPGMQNTWAACKNIEHDIQEGTPPYVIVGRYNATLGSFDSNIMVELHRVGFGIFKNLGEDPPFRQLEPLPLTSAVAHQATWDGTTAQGTGSQSYLAFSLPEPVLVASIDIECSTYPGMRISWGRTDDTRFVETGAWTALPLVTGQNGPIFIGDTIDQIRITLGDKAVSVSKIVPTIVDTPK